MMPTVIYSGVSLLTFLIDKESGYVDWGHTELRISGPVIVLPIDNTDLRAAVEGISDRNYVDEGDEVKAGDLIARLSDKELRAALNQAEAETRETGAWLQMLEAGPTAYEIEVAKAAVGKTEDRVKYAQNRQVRLQNLLLRESLVPKRGPGGGQRGEEALRVLRHQSCNTALLLTDIVMPGISGTQLAAEVFPATPRPPSAASFSSSCPLRLSMALSTTSVR